MISDVLGKLVTVKMFFNHVKQSNKVPQKSPDLQNVTDFSVTPRYDCDSKIYCCVICNYCIALFLLAA